MGPIMVGTMGPVAPMWPFLGPTLLYVFVRDCTVVVRVRTCFDVFLRCSTCFYVVLRVSTGFYLFMCVYVFVRFCIRVHLHFYEILCFLILRL